MDKITTVEEIEKLYGSVHPGAIIKKIDHISDHYRAYIDAAPLMIVASSGINELDCSPRGDPAGSFVRIEDSHTILIPDRPGNNRVDTLHNILHDPRIALLFILPGIGVTIRVNGRAEISADMPLRESFAFAGKLPKSVIRVSVMSAFFHCPKAFIRSDLWKPEKYVDPKSLPSVGTMMEAIEESFDGEAWDAEYPERIRQTIY